MPFKSEAQRRYLWANEPEIARNWTDKYGNRIQKENGGIMRLGFQDGNDVDDDETLWEWIKKMGTGAKDTAKKYTSMAFGPLMMAANRYNPLNPDAVNYNPLLSGQRDFALRPTSTGGLGFTQDDIGRFTGSLDPYSTGYNPLYGKNLISGFGTNDLTKMLQKRLEKLQGYDYKSDIKKRKEAQIQAMLGRAKEQDIRTVRDTPSIPSHYLEQGGGGYQDMPTHSAKEAMSRGVDVTRGGMMGPGGRHYAQGGLIDFYKNGGFGG